MTVRSERSSAIAASVAVGVAVVAAALRVIRGGWAPVGDNAYFALRSRDVLTEHHPLLGTWTSASQTVGFDVNNPGPLLFDVFAVPAKIDPDLLPLGVAALVLGSIAVAALCAARVAGARGVLATMLASASLAWAMGPELVADPWQPHSLLFPFLAVIVASWAAWAGSDGALLAVVALGSLVVQTHLSYAPVVALLGGSSAAVVLVRAVRRESERRHAVRMLAAAGVLGLVLWSQPLAEQVQADDRGNLSRIVDVASADKERTVGLTDGVRVSGTLLAPVPQWRPPSFTTDFAPRPDDPAPRADDAAALPLVLNGAPSRTGALVAIASTLVALAAVGVVAHRRRIAVLRAGAGVATVCVVGAVVSAVVLPVSAYGLPAHQLRWLWPIAVAVTTVLAGGLLARRAGVVVVAGATVLMAALAIEPTDPRIGPTADGDVAPVLRQLAPQLDALRDAGPLVLAPEGLAPFEPYSIPVLLELDGRGIEVRVEDPVLIRQLGPSRAATGAETGRIHVWQAELAVDGAPGLEQIAVASTLSDAEMDELEQRTAQVARWIEQGELRLSELGRRAVAAGRLPDLDEVAELDPDPYAASGARTFRAAAVRGFLAAPRREADLRRWTLLGEQFDRLTVGVWLERA